MLYNLRVLIMKYYAFDKVERDKFGKENKLKFTKIKLVVYKLTKINTH